MVEQVGVEDVVATARHDDRDDVIVVFGSLGVLLRDGQRHGRTSRRWISARDGQPRAEQRVIVVGDAANGVREIRDKAVHSVKLEVRVTQQNHLARAG